MSASRVIYDSSDYEFLRHEACPECGGSDSVGVWLHKPTGKETKTCFSEKRNCTYRVTTGDLLRTAQPGKTLTDEQAKPKGLTADIAKKYHITKDGKVIYFGFVNPSGKLVGLAGRNYAVPKHDDNHFFWKQNCNLLYGMYGATGDKLIIVSGFWDAPSAYMMTGIPTVSLPNGDKSAKNAITDNYQWLKRFKKIYIAFDNDESGKVATVKALEILGYRAREVVLPEYTLVLESGTVTVKDANDYLKYGLAAEFVKAINAADTRVNPYVTTSASDILYSQYKLRGADNGWTTGIDELDNLVKFRPNEFTLLFGAPGKGKSTIARHFIAASLSDGIKPYYISMEDPVWVCIDNLIKVVLNEQIPYDAFGNCMLSEAELQDKARMVRERVYIAQMEQYSPDVLSDAIECAYVMYGCTFVVIDHITWLLNLEDDARVAAVKYMNVIADLCKRYPIHVLVVSHNKPADISLVQKQHSKKFQADWEEYLEPTARDAQWSSVFEQTAWNIWGWKNPSDTSVPAKLYVLKNRVGGMKRLGVVLCYFDELTNRYMGVTAYAKAMSGKQRKFDNRRSDDSIRLATGEDNPRNVQSADNPESEGVQGIHGSAGSQVEEYSGTNISPVEEGSCSDNRSDDSGITTDDESVHNNNLESRFPMYENGVDNRVQRGDGEPISQSGGGFQSSTSAVVSKIKAALSEAGFEDTLQKTDLPKVGGTTRNRVGIFQPNKENESGRDTTFMDSVNLSGKWASLLR